MKYCDPFKAFFEHMVELGHIEIDPDTGVYKVVNIRAINRIMFGVPPEP